MKVIQLYDFDGKTIEMICSKALTLHKGKKNAEGQRG